MRLYLDACAIIYGIEGAPPVREAAVRFAEQAEAATDGLVITSQLSRLECRVKPLRDGAMDVLAASTRSSLAVACCWLRSARE